MFNNQDQYGISTPERNIVPAGTTFLLAVTIIVVALFCGLGGYALSLRTLQQLQQQGYDFWTNSSFDSPVLVNFAFIGGSTWVNNQPGQSLSIAFATQPMLRGILGFGFFAVGGVLSLYAARHFRGASRRHPGLIIGLVLCFMGIQSAFEPPPDTITINLASHALRDGSTAIALGDVNGFGTYTHNSRHDHDTDLFVQHAGNDTNLATFSDASDAQSMQTALQTFVSSGGTQL